jgi:TorA maturation chaperone TorD
MQHPDNTMTETENSTLSPVQMAQLRQALYRFLAMLFLYPDQDRLANVQIAAGELLEARSAWISFEFGPKVERLLMAQVSLNDEAAEQVEEEYNHLIRVKPVAPPYESFYLDPQGQARGVIASQLETEYASAGLALSSSLQDMPDHLTVELEFMSFLCAGEVRARETANEPDNVQVRIRQRSFLNEHLVRWFPQFARRLADAAPESLYSVIAAAAYAFLRYELEYLGLRK